MRSGHPSLNAPPSVQATRGFGVAELSLLGVAFMFGLTFVLTQQAIERLPVTAFWPTGSCPRPCSSRCCPR